MEVGKILCNLPFLKKILKMLGLFNFEVRMICSLRASVAMRPKEINASSA